jgi:hypothetical protein
MSHSQAFFLVMFAWGCIGIGCGIVSFAAHVFFPKRNRWTKQ